MAFNNTYNINTVLHEHKHQQDENETDWLKELSMDDVIGELVFSLLQAGDHVLKSREQRWYE